MASTIIQPVADKLATMLTALGLGVNTWARLALRPGTAGMAEIEIPDVTRTAPEQAESQLGADDWDLEYLVTIWVPLTDGISSQRRLVEVLEDWIAAIDADVTLGGLVLEAKVTSARRQYQTEPTQLVGYETTLAALKLV
jgi:hypothetical protein